MPVYIVTFDAYIVTYDAYSVVTQDRVQSTFFSKKLNERCHIEIREFVIRLMVYLKHGYIFFLLIGRETQKE